MIRLGILGAGRIAHHMAETVVKMNESGSHEVELYAIGARDLDRAQSFAAAYGIPKAFGSYEAMLSDPALDLVYVATPHSHHHDHAMLCLNHGKHVLCEKAFTVNAHEAEDVIRLAEQKGLLVTEAVWTRYQPMRKLIWDAIYSGEIGTPRTLTANLSFPLLAKERMVVPELAGGALLDVGMYALTFAEMIFGHPDQVQAVAQMNADGLDVTDSITLLWKDGRTAVLVAGMDALGDSCGVIYGTKGYAVVENINNPTAITIHSRENGTRRVERPAQLTGYEYEVTEARLAIENGELECPSMLHAETLHMMRLMDHIRAQIGLRYPMDD